MPVSAIRCFSCSFVFAVFSITTNANAQSLVLSGNYIQVGVNSKGTLGYSGNTSPGILYDGTGTGTFNTAYDYLTPGTPFEGFAVAGTAGSTFVLSNNNAYSAEITGGVLTDQSGVNYAGAAYDNRAVWTATSAGLFTIVNDYHFNDGDQKLVIATTISALADISNLTFSRQLDPDARAASGDSSSTNNFRGSGSIPAADLVYAEALVSRYVIGLYTDTSLTHNSAVTDWTRDTESYLSGTDVGNGDNTIGLGFSLGDLANGSSITFSYAYIFGTSIAEGIGSNIGDTIGDITATNTTDEVAAGAVNPVFDGGTLVVTGDGVYAQTYSITANGGTIDTDGYNAAFSGVISGESGLTKTGLGTLILMGANTYSGTTTVEEGTLVGTTSTIPGNVVTNSLFILDQSSSGAFSGLISGQGVFRKDGPGRVTLSGANSYEGGTILAGGFLAVSADASLGALSGNLTFQGGGLATTTSFSSARNVNLGTGGGVIETAAETALTLSGTVSGLGALVKSGTGTLILTGTNTYSGGTLIAEGTLQIGDGGTSGSIIGNVVNNGALVFARSDTYAFPGTITGEGTVTFLGGTVLFSTPGAYAGDIQVSEATMTLQNTTSSGSAVTIESGGIIKGNGAIGSLVVRSGGVAAPGNSPGTIQVSGGVSFDAGSVYQVDVTPSGAHDLILATGSVSLSDGARVQVLAEPGTYAPRTTYAIITTSGAVSGAFGGVTSDYAFLSPRLTYDAQNVYLTLTYNGVAFSSFGETPNARNAATAVQALGEGNALFETVIEASSASVSPLLASLSGEAYASVNTVLQQQSIYVREAVGARLRQSLAPAGHPALAYAAASAGPQTAQLGAGLAPTLWAQGYGGWGQTFSDGNAATLSNSIGGFLIGADVALAANAQAGVFGGFSQSQLNVDARASTGSIDNYDIGAYAGMQIGPLALRAGAAYAWHDVSVGRSPVLAGIPQSLDAGFTNGTTQLFGEAAYDVTVGGYALEPFAGLAYVSISGAGLSESGGAASLSGSLSGMDTLYSTLGLRAATSLPVMGRTLTPSLSVAWQHAFGDTAPVASLLFSGGTTPFSVTGVPVAEDMLALNAGLSLGLSETANLAVNYSGQLAATASQNAFTAQFSLRF